MNKQFDMNRFNSFLDKAQQAISCGPECQREKVIDDLKNKFNTAQSNLILAEPQYQAAKRNYYTYVSGQNGYNQMLEDELHEKADSMVAKFKEATDEEVQKIKSQIQTYDGLLINFRNVVDLYKQYKSENIKLYKQLKEDTNDILTNDRKTYYEDQQNENLNGYYYYILIVIYIIVLICFIVFSLFFPSQTSFQTKIVLILLFIGLPFISTWILGKIIYIIYWLFGMLPKNVYK
jgi:hypothetical protein